jgi:hypothetical protein
MTGKPTDPEDQLDKCPLHTTHRRLLDAHQLWHQAAATYSDPDAFRANLNATIQALRNVTFAVQSEKHVFGAFDDWYAPWQVRLGANSALKWIKDARNQVVKQGDLETESTATVRLLTWRDYPIATVPVAPSTSSEILLNNLPILEIGRRWSLSDFENREVLDVLDAAYGTLSDLVKDAHIQVGQVDCISQSSPHPSFRAVRHRAGTIPCMVSNSELRKERFELASMRPLQRVNSQSPLSTVTWKSPPGGTDC